MKDKPFKLDSLRDLLHYVPFNEGAYAPLETDDIRRLAAAQSAIFLVVYYLVALGYFLGLSKPKVTVREVQRLAGKCVAFSLAVLAAKLFTSRPFPLTDDLKDEISHWLFLANWGEPLPWRDEKHIVVSMATDASSSGWGGVILLPISKKVSDYWVGEECNWDIATKEAMAIDRMLLSNCDFLRDTRVDVHVDNQAVLQAWNNEQGRSHMLIQALKNIFFTTLNMNVALHLIYVPTKAKTRLIYRCAVCHT
ncbi:Hypothetical predicted protein [Paramuricea clavata]|uniref:Uncharacterized protein n=1 Tax=Paramuricea clavata TaxID=317549 RepID=A0A6S7FHE6_PARCT|nr:Hypothetical predicted protein [Paramuricea clavata]